MRSTLFRVICAALTLMLSITAFATPPSSSISLYSSENAKKPIRELPFSTELVAIIQHGDWMKVGLRPSGDTGWINIPQYQQAQNNYYQPQSQSISVNITRDKDGKPTTHITAYRNGKKMSDKEAQALYQHMQQEQRATWQPPFQNEHLEQSLNRFNYPQPSIQPPLNTIPELQPLDMNDTTSQNSPNPLANALSGQYTDPKHPNGSRKITVTGDKITIIGQDQAHAPQWTVHGVILGHALLIDFSPKGGPKNLKAQFNATSITFEDGNTWHRVTTTP